MDQSETVVDPSEFSVVTHDGQPAIELPDGQLVVLRTHVAEWTHESPQHGDNVDMRVEVDADEYAWWSLYPERTGTQHHGEDAFPEICIEPEVVDGV